jgi:hypothetical protein
MEKLNYLKIFLQPRKTVITITEENFRLNQIILFLLFFLFSLLQFNAIFLQYTFLDNDFFFSKKLWIPIPFGMLGHIFLRSIISLLFINLIILLFTKMGKLWNTKINFKTIFNIFITVFFIPTLIFIISKFIQINTFKESNSILNLLIEGGFKFITVNNIIFGSFFVFLFLICIIIFSICISKVEKWPIYKSIIYGFVSILTINYTYKLFRAFF